MFDGRFSAKIIRFFLVVLAVALTFSACTSDNPTGSSVAEPSESQKYAMYEGLPAFDKYLEYLERSADDPQGAIRDLCHYEMEDIREIALEQYDPITSYEILKFEKLSDQLWIASTFSKSLYTPEGSVSKNYIGIIDGEYFVMLSLRQVPQELREGLDLE